MLPLILTRCVTHRHTHTDTHTHTQREHDQAPLEQVNNAVCDGSSPLVICSWTSVNLSPGVFIGCWILIGCESRLLFINCGCFFFSTSPPPTPHPLTFEPTLTPSVLDVRPERSNHKWSALNLDRNVPKSVLGSDHVGSRSAPRSFQCFTITTHTHLHEHKWQSWLFAYQD